MIKVLNKINSDFLKKIINKGKEIYNKVDIDDYFLKIQQVIKLILPIKKQIIISNDFFKISDILNLDMNHKFIPLTYITESGTAYLSSLFKMNFIKIELFDSVFT